MRCIRVCRCRIRLFHLSGGEVKYILHICRLARSASYRARVCSCDAIMNKKRAATLCWIFIRVDAECIIERESSFNSSKRGRKKKVEENHFSFVRFRKITLAIRWKDTVASTLTAFQTTRASFIFTSKVLFPLRSLHNEVLSTCPVLSWN